MTPGLPSPTTEYISNVLTRFKSPCLRSLALAVTVTATVADTLVTIVLAVILPHPRSGCVVALTLAHPCRRRHSPMCCHHPPTLLGRGIVRGYRSDGTMHTILCVVPTLLSPSHSPSLLIPHRKTHRGCGYKYKFSPGMGVGGIPLQLPRVSLAWASCPLGQGRVLGTYHTSHVSKLAGIDL